MSENTSTSTMTPEYKELVAQSLLDLFRVVHTYQTKIDNNTDLHNAMQEHINCLERSNTEKQAKIDRLKKSCVRLNQQKLKFRNLNKKNYAGKRSHKVDTFDLKKDCAYGELEHMTKEKFMSIVYGDTDSVIMHDDADFNATIEATKEKDMLSDTYGNYNSRKHMTKEKSDLRFLDGNMGFPSAIEAEMEMPMDMNMESDDVISDDFDYDDISEENYSGESDDDFDYDVLSAEEANDMDSIEDDEEKERIRKEVFSISMPAALRSKLLTDIDSA